MSRAAFPASFAQQRLWFLDQLDPGTAAYNLPRAFRIDGPLNIDILKQALQFVIRRHASLRTVFDSVEGEARQVVLSDVELSLPVTDLTDVPEAEREAEALRIASEEGKKPFDLSEGPLLRALLLQMGPNSFMLLLVMHHIITDGWSISILFREVTSSYAAFIGNQVPQLPDIPLQYTDYAHWQRDYLSGEVLTREVEHWKDKLSGAQTLLDLPADRPRPATHSCNGATEEITFESAVLRKLKALAQSESSTLFMAAIAAFQC